MAVFQREVDKGEVLDTEWMTEGHEGSMGGQGMAGVRERLLGRMSEFRAPENMRDCWDFRGKHKGDGRDFGGGGDGDCRFQKGFPNVMAGIGRRGAESCREGDKVIARFKGR